jgi:uncharacterized sulfatase
MTRRELMLSMMAAGRRRPNIILMPIDDLNTDLGCYGHGLVQSPNIDRLARRGVRFDTACAQYPVCNPSRASLLSGRYPETTRVLDNRVNPRTFLKNSRFLPEYLRSQGYFTASIGKIFHDGMDGDQDWEVHLNPRGTDLGRKGEGRNLTGGKFPFFVWRAAEGNDEDQPDGQTAAEAVKLLTDKRDKPFFLGVGFRKPHDQYVAPKKYFDLYPPERIPAVEGPPDDTNDMPEAALPPQNHGLGPAEAREFRRAYWSCISFMDAQVGKVLDALELSPHRDNTIVVFFGDHGLHLGEHGWWNKVTLFDRSARAPLIIAAMGIQDPGATCRRPVEYVDFYPTLMELCGLPAPPGLQGRSLVPLLRNVEAPWDKPAYTVVGRGAGKLGRSIRTERYRYTEWDEGRMGVELYDHSTDLNEYRNRATDGEYAPVIQQMKNLLKERMRNAKA